MVQVIPFYIIQKKKKSYTILYDLSLVKAKGGHPPPPPRRTNQKSSLNKNNNNKLIINPSKKNH